MYAFMLVPAALTVRAPAAVLIGSEGLVPMLPLVVVKDTVPVLVKSPPANDISDTLLLPWLAT